MNKSEIKIHKINSYLSRIKFLHAFHIKVVPLNKNVFDLLKEVGSRQPARTPIEMKHKHALHETQICGYRDLEMPM